METLLISTQTLAGHLDDPAWTIIDCRFELSKPESGAAQYREAHIPGAVTAHLDRDLAGAVMPTTGRHPLPTPADFEQTARRLGIGAESQVVVYDAAGGSFAVRLWWLLRLFGHNAAAVLDGGFPKWQAESRPVRAGEERNPPGNFTSQPQSGLVATGEEVLARLNDPRLRLVDARAPERFRGEVEPLDPVAGHIPGAINRYYGLNLNPDGTFKTAGELRAEYERLLGAAGPEDVIVYCGSGVTSIHDLLAMERAGLPGARIYAGSWSEWIRDPQHPVEKG